MTAKERLRNLVDDLSEEEAATALPIIERGEAVSPDELKRGLGID